MVHDGRFRRFAWPLLVAALILAADQTTKWLVVRWLGPNRGDHRVDLLDPLLAVEYVENTGAAFGTFRGHGGFLGLLAVVVLGGLLVYYGRMPNPNRWIVMSVGLLLGGACGNLLDRARLGHVVDFVAVGVWPKFNLADSAISVGVVLLAWQVLMSDEPAANNGVAEQRAGTTLLAER